MAEDLRSTEYQGQIIGADVLLVTVTEVETMAILNLFPEFRKRFIGNETYYELGVIGGTRTYLMQSAASTLDVGETYPSLAEGIKLLSPSAVVMVGVAYGIHPETQHIGEILVSQQLLNYRLQRTGSGNDNKTEIILSGSRPEASTRLVN